MTYYQTYSRLRHLLTAKHYRGHGIHSPSLYNLVRQVFMGSNTGTIVQKLTEMFPAASVVASEDVGIIDASADIKVVLRPFKSKADYAAWRCWRAANPCQSVWLKSALVIFHDPRLQNQHFDIRT